MRFLLAPFGSAGDFLPYLWMGKVLIAAGHEATIVGSPYFAELCRSAGVPLAPWRSATDGVNLDQDSRLFDVQQSPEMVFTWMGESAGDIYQLIRELSPDRDTVIIAPSCMFAARVARESLGLRLINVFLQPVAMVSMYDTPVLSEEKEAITRWPVWLKKLCFRYMPNPIDQFPAPGIRKLCAEVGVRPAKSLFREWWHSPDGAIILFPEFLGEPQPDWPQLRAQVGFPLYDTAEDQPLPADLEAFLAAGEKPILVTPGSAMRKGREFFAAALEAVTTLDRRAIFVTRFPDQLPASLPPTVFHVSFCSFTRLAPRVAALVHHGGIGTLGQALRAGIPQLILPTAHDQPDNATRLHRLGVGAMLYPRLVNAANVTEKLRELLESPQVAERCRHYQAFLAEVDPAANLETGLERMLGLERTGRATVGAA